MSELLRGTDEQQRRMLVCTGAAVIVVSMIVYLVVSAWPSREPADTVKIVLATPTLGEGIDVGSKVLLHGVAVGAVTTINHHGELTDMGILLRRNDTRGLTDSFRYDFRPANTFGISALSLLPEEGGNAISNGQRIERSPEINATMSRVLTGQVNIVNKVLTDKLAQLIGRSVEYTGALAPLFETGFVLTSLIAQTQQEMPTVLLGRVNRILEPLPIFTDTFLASAHNLRVRQGVEEFTNKPDRLMGSIELAGTDLFGKAGDVLGKYQIEFGPGAEIVRTFADSFSSLIQRSRGSLRLDKLLDGLTEVYNGPTTTKTNQKSFKLKVILEPLPVLESALPPVSDLDGTSGGAR